ncbi:MAG: hypothetical protein ACRD1Q_07750, partial [Vicinamibacterales bacterium]
MCKLPSHVGRAVAALLVCCVLHAKAGYGQSTGVVVGQVVDETNVALPGVTVEWQSPDTLVPQ